MRHAYDIRRDTTVEARYAREAMEARMLERLLHIYEQNAARSGPLGDIREADVIRQVIMITSQAPRLSGAEETIYIENLTRLGQLATRGYAFSLRAHPPTRRCKPWFGPGWRAAISCNGAIRFPGRVMTVFTWCGPTGACRRWSLLPCVPLGTAPRLYT